MANQITVDVYNFDSVGNKYVSKKQVPIPMPALFVPATSPDPTVYCYSKIVYQFPQGFVKEAYTAETVAQLTTKANA